MRKNASNPSAINSPARTTMCRQPSSRKSTAARHRNSSTRSGFTLIELLLALGLCGLLMSATMSAVHLSWKYRVEGDWAVENSERMRGVYNDLATDLRNAVGPNLRAADGPSGVPSAAFEALQTLIERDDENRIEQTDFTEQFLDIEVSGQIDPVHFYGESGFFMVLTGRASHRFPENAANTALRHVVWTASDSSLRVPFHLRDGRKHDSALASQSVRGLVRWSRNFDARTESVGLPEAVEILPNATSANFRYFDGRQWLRSWDSHERRQMPVAVEIQLVTAEHASRQFVVSLPQSAQRESRR